MVYLSQGIKFYLLKRLKWTPRRLLIKIPYPRGLQLWSGLWQNGCLVIKIVWFLGKDNQLERCRD